MADAPADEPKPALCDDGVDLALIRWMLSLTPRERLPVLQRHMNAISAEPFLPQNLEQVRVVVGPGTKIHPYHQRPRDGAQLGALQ